MIEAELPADHVVDREIVQRSIALSYVKAWIDLPRAPADLLGTVLPVLAAQESRETSTILLSAEAFGDNHPDAHRMVWKDLKKAAIAVHRSPVRHLWYRWNPKTGKEHRCIADLIWATEVRADPVRREVELVFWPRLIEYLPAILVSLSDFETRPLAVSVTPTANRSPTDYFYKRQP